MKTRIAHAIGEDAALEIYQILLKILSGRIYHQDWTTHLWTDAQWHFSHDFPSQFEGLSLQVGDDLGQKMLFAFQSHFIQGASRVIIIGVDSPDICSDIIRQGFDLLKEKEVVLGPAKDGGYYLIGLRRPLPSLFDDIAWSTSKVFASTIDKIRAGGYSYALLPMLSDIDTVADWEEYLIRKKVFHKD